jgi:hypothetical protein
MDGAMPIAAQCNQVLLGVAARSAPRNDVMDVELLTPPEPLATPAIAFENFPTQSTMGRLVLSWFVSQAAPTKVALSQAEN